MKEDLIKLLNLEFGKLLRVFKAIPEGQLDYRPHEKSRSSKEMMQLLIGELSVMIGMIDGIIDFETALSASRNFETPEEYATALEGMMTQVIDKMKASPEENFAIPMEFFGDTMPRAEAIHDLLHDVIHHRGQMSVYIRLSGGVVPSIYGPSADNLS